MPTQLPLPFADSDGFNSVYDALATGEIPTGYWQDERITNIGNWTVLGSGCSRIAFDLGDGRVLKVAVDRSSRNTNMREASFYATTQEKYREVLCPILDSDPDGRWVVMPKAEKVGYVKTADMRRVKATLARIVWDNHEMNMGYYNGKAVMIDYAS